MTIGERIKKRREELGISVDELAAQLGKNRATIYRYESSDIVKLPTTVLEPLANALKTSPAYLMGWDNETSNSNTALTFETPYHVPIFNSVSAGFGAYASSDIVGYMPMVIANPHDFKDTICIKVKGDSMYPKIEDGDVITVRKQATVDNGQIAVVRIGDECVVKKVELGKNFLKMISINPEYKDRILKDSELEGVEIVGLVQQVTKKL